MFRGGGLAEWSKALDSKSSVPATVPWVRIPRPPLTVPKCSLVERGASFFEPPPTNALAEARRRETTGGVTEWSKVHDWKSCVPATVPRVRIPPPPLSLMGCPDTPIPVVLPTLAREPRQARKGATVSVSSVWRGLFFGGPERRPSLFFLEGLNAGPPPIGQSANGAPLPDYAAARCARAASPPTGRWGPRGSRFRYAKAGRLFASLRSLRLPPLRLPPLRLPPRLALSLRESWPSVHCARPRCAALTPVDRSVARAPTPTTATGRWGPRGSRFRCAKSWPPGRFAALAPRPTDGALGPLRLALSRAKVG